MSARVTVTFDGTIEDVVKDMREFLGATSLMTEMKDTLEKVRETPFPDEVKEEVKTPVKRGRKPKVEVKEEAFEVPEPSVELVSYTLDDIIDALKKYAAKNSREKAIKVLEKFDVKSVRDIPENRFSEFLDSLK